MSFGGFSALGQHSDNPCEVKQSISTCFVIGRLLCRCSVALPHKHQSCFLCVLAELLSSADVQQRPAAFSEVAQQMADLESKVVSANNHITRLELQLDVCAAEQHAVEQAAAVQSQQFAAGWKVLAQEVDRMHGDKQLPDSAR